ncbi:MAG TPA: alpha/beta fold hydrolase [Ktedonobacterales bacterium]
MPEFATSADGTRIAFERAGAGPALLLLHCLPGDLQYWRAAGYLDALGQHFTVAVIDTRGFGASDAPTDLAAYAEPRILGDMLAVADALGAAQFSVWGHSYGATIARELAATSDRVTRAVMAGGHFGPIFTPERAAEAQAELEPLAQAQQAADPIAALDALDVPPDEREEALNFPARTTLLTIQSLVGWRPTQPADLRCPTLIVTGTRDTRVLEALEAQRAAIAAADVQVLTLPDLDHEQLVSARTVVLPAVLLFLLA